MGKRGRGRPAAAAAAPDAAPSTNVATESSEGDDAGGDLGAPHPYGVQPWGNYYGAGAQTTPIRDAGLGGACPSQ